MVRALVAMATAAALWGAGVASADSWLAPYEQDYYSADQAYYLHVVPGDGAKHARGTLYETARREGDDREVWSRELLNPTAPYQVLVADSGEYVVTSDDWGQVGYGPNVVVIYGPGGELVKQFALEDLLTEEEIALVPHSVSSRWWSGEHALDEEAGAVVLKVIAGGMTEEMKARTRDLRVALATGEVLP